MTTFKITGLLAAFAGAGAIGLIAQAPPPTPGPPPQTAPGEEFTDEELLKTYGFFVAAQTGIAEMDLGEEEFEAFLDGFRHALESSEPPHDFDRVGPHLQAYLQEKQEAAGARAAEAGRAEAAEFFAELAERDGVESTPSGLHYEIIELGDGATPGPEDTVRIHYKGTLIDGQTFDSSYDRGEPADFPLTGVIPGMSEGLQLLPEGSEAILYIPSDLGYGNQGQASIPPGSTLIFEVEVIEVID